MTDVHSLLTDAAEQVRVPALDLDGLRRSARRRRARRRAGLLAAAALVTAVPLGGIMAAGLLPSPQDRLVQPVPPASAAPAPDPWAAPSTVKVSPRLLQVVQFDGSWLEEPTAAFGRESVVAGKDIGPGLERRGFTAFAVAFEPLRVPLADCVQEAVLVMRPSETTGVGELRAYPAAALSLAEGRVPPNGDRASALIDNRPFGAEIILADGSHSYDVTELVRRYAAGADFPSRGRSVPPGSPIVMVLRPPAEDEGVYSRTFDVAASPPVLRAQLAKGCVAG